VSIQNAICQGKFEFLIFYFIYFHQVSNIQIIIVFALALAVTTHASPIAELSVKNNPPSAQTKSFMEKVEEVSQRICQ